MLKAALRKPQSIAISFKGVDYSYQQLLDDSAAVAKQLLGSRHHLNGERVSFLYPSGYEYVAILWGIWRAGGIAVPLCTSHPALELEYVIHDSQSEYVFYDDSFVEVMDKVRLPANILRHSFPQGDEAVERLPEISDDDAALIIYTSGTTGKPKGVVSTHGNINAQVTTLVDAWGWSEHDQILQFLPLHHIHGIINVVSCCMWAGARCHMLPKFDAQLVWQHICDKPLTLLMAVPTVYSKLSQYYYAQAVEDQKRMTEACGKFRLMISGSAALPVPMLEQWQKISGHTLLERYGMTEIGMAISNPYQGERRAGHVGLPLPNVDVRLVDDEGKPVKQGESGQIQIKGPCVFKEYWQKPEATEEAFSGGWFNTGDVAELSDGYYRILGRSSVDIIKSGGYKLSALEIEEKLLSHPNIDEVAVVGIPDEEWGELVAAALVSKSPLTIEDIKHWSGDRLANYKLPRRVILVDSLPRNAMGKVTKKSVKALF